MATYINPLQRSLYLDKANEGGGINFANLEKNQKAYEVEVKSIQPEVVLSDEEYIQIQRAIREVYHEASKDFKNMTSKFREYVKSKTGFIPKEEAERIRKSEQKFKEVENITRYAKEEMDSYFESIGRVPTLQEYEGIKKLLKESPSLSVIKQAREADFAEYKSFANELLNLPAKEEDEAKKTTDDSKNQIAVYAQNAESILNDEEIYKEFPYLAPSLNDDPMKLAVGKKQAELRFESANMIEQELEEEEEKNKAFQRELLEINDLLLELMKVGATPDQINELRERKKKLEEIAMGAGAKAVKKIKDAIVMQMGEASKLVTNMLRNLKGDEKRAFKIFLKEGGMKQISESPSIGAVKNILSGFVKQVKGKTLAIKIKDMKMDQFFDNKKKHEETKAYKKNNQPSPIDKYKYKELMKKVNENTENKEKEKDRKPKEKEKKEETKEAPPPPPPPAIGR